MRAFAEIGLQRRKVRSARTVLDDEFAVDHRVADRQRLERVDDFLPNFLRPVEPAAGQEFDPPAVDPRDQAIAVELDLVDPASRRRRLATSVASAGSTKSGSRGLAALLTSMRRGPSAMAFPRERLRAARDVCASASSPASLRLARLGFASRLFDLAGLGRPARRLARDFLHHAARLHRFRPLFQNVRIAPRRAPRRPRL